MVLQALAAIPSIDSEAVQQRLDRVRTYYELLNMPFEVSQPNQQLHFECNFCQVILSWYSYFCHRPCLHSLQNIYTCLLLLSKLIEIVLVITFYGTIELYWHYFSAGMPTSLMFRSLEGRFLLMLKTEYPKYYPFSVFIHLFIFQSLFWIAGELAANRFLILISDGTTRCRCPVFCEVRTG